MKEWLNNSKSVIRLNTDEKKLKTLLLFLIENWIKVMNIIGKPTEEWVLVIGRNNYIVSMDAEILVKACYDEVYKILDSNEIFKQNTDKLLWVI